MSDFIGISKGFSKLGRRCLLVGMTAIAGTTMIGTSLFAADPIKVAVLVPDSGAAGLFGPSTRNAATLAAEQINSRGGIAGSQIELVFADAGLSPADVVGSVVRLVRQDKVSAIVGMHDSAVRVAVANAVRQQVPYIYTPVYEGGECAAGVYVLGETPQQQLATVIPWLSNKKDLKKWYLIGNDYNWPRNTNDQAKGYIAKAGGAVVGEEYLSFDVSNFDASIRNIQASGADTVLITLVGGASVGFNVAFAQFGLADDVVRLGTLIEENTLAGIGAANAKNLYSSSGYFASNDSAANKRFTAGYAARFGADAAQLNSLGESAYEGLLFLEAAGNRAGSLDFAAFDKVANGTSFNGPRGAVKMANRHVNQSIYLANGTGGTFSVEMEFKNVASGETCM